MPDSNKPVGPKWKNKDILIAADDGKLYYLTPADLPKYEVPEEQWPERIEDLLANGFAFGWVPVPRPGNLTCYLVNLSSLRRRNPFEPTSPHAPRVEGSGDDE